MQSADDAEETDKFFHKDETNHTNEVVFVLT